MKGIFQRGQYNAGTTVVRSDEQQANRALPLELGAIYEAHALQVANWAARLGGPTLDPEDLLQEVFLVVSEKLASYRPEAKLTTWLYAITAKVVRDRRRRERRRWLRNLLGGREQEPTTRPTQVEDLERRQATELIYRVLNSMKEKYRAVIILFDLQGYSGEEIAELTSTKIETVWVRLHRARAMFRKQIEHLNGYELEAMGLE